MTHEKLTSNYIESLKNISILEVEENLDDLLGCKTKSGKGYIVCKKE
jgi:hypothetical protein